MHSSEKQSHLGYQFRPLKSITDINLLSAQHGRLMDNMEVPSKRHTIAAKDKGLQALQIIGDNIICVDRENIC